MYMCVYIYIYIYVYIYICILLVESNAAVAPPATGIFDSVIHMCMFLSTSMA